MKPRLFLPSLVFLPSFLCVACLEKESEDTIQNLDEKLEGQRFDIGRTTEFVAAERAKLAGYKKAKSDAEEAKKLTTALEKIQSSLEEAEARNSDVSISLEITQVEFEKYRKIYRDQARKAAIGTTVDLSDTMGEDFKAVRILSMTPLKLKIYTPSGPLDVPVKKLTPELLDQLQMGEDEVKEYYEKQQASAAFRADKLKQWKAGQAKRNAENAKAAYRDKIVEIQEEIYKREGDINTRIQEIKAWKSKASNLELRIDQEKRKKSRGRAKQLRRQADLARDKADDLGVINSNTWIVIGRMRAELDSLRRQGPRK